MDDIHSRSYLRERILNDLRNIVKQVYHESVNNELSPENKNYICLTLIKNLDEALRHGLKQLHIGYWKVICEILHPQDLQSVEQLPTYDATESSLLKGRAWIAYSLRQDSFSNYIHCLVNETSLEKYYENWSILRTNDTCNWFLSILSGLNNILFTFDLEYVNKPPVNCNFGIKILPMEDKEKIMQLDLSGSKSSITSTTLTSPVDSGVHIQDSTSDMEQLLDDKQLDIDYLNGNIPETVFLRKNKKSTKRHVSFHEDIIYKSPDKCRKLKWDSENLRYSWGGEELNPSILKEANFSEMKIQSNRSNTPVKILDINERGAPEGEETPTVSEVNKQSCKSQKSVFVQRFLQSIRKQAKINKQISKECNCFRYNYNNIKIDKNVVAEINEEIKRELESKPKISVSKIEVTLNPSIVKEMIRNQSIYKTYKLRDYLFLITNANLYLINKNLEMKRISFSNLTKITVYPGSHVFLIHESDEESHYFVTGDSELTNEVLGRLELSMRRNRYDPPQFIMLDHKDMFFVKRSLVEHLAIEKQEQIIYCGAISLNKNNDLLSSVLPNTKRGFLMYRNVRDGDSWTPGDFCLKNGILYLFEEESNFPKLAINVATGCQSCSRTKNPDRPYTFQISLLEKDFEFYSETNNLSKENSIKAKMLKSDTQKLLSDICKKVNKLLTFGSSKQNNCILEFAASSDCELTEWLQMIIQASCGDVCEEASKDYLIQGMLWLTTNSLIITNEFIYPECDIDIISRAKLHDVAAYRMGKSEKDYFTVIEFICMEAGSTSGDWILFMNSREELEILKSTLQIIWKFSNKFPCEYLKEGKLCNHCRRCQENFAANYWIQLLH